MDCVAEELADPMINFYHIWQPDKFNEYQYCVLFSHNPAYSNEVARYTMSNTILRDRYVLPKNWIFIEKVPLQEDQWS